MNQNVKQQNFIKYLLFSAAAFCNVIYVLLAVMLITYEEVALSTITVPFTLLVALSALSLFMQVMYTIKSTKITDEYDFNPVITRGIIRLALMQIPGFIGLVYFVIEFGMV